MEEFAARFADFVEGIAIKVRGLTVDRVDKGIRLTGLGILAATFGFASVLFVFWALFGAAEIPLTTAGAFALFAAIFVGAGMIFWSKRT